MLQILKWLVKFGNIVTRLYEDIHKITQLIFKYKQATIILLTFESKYMVVPHAPKEAIWDKQVISGLGFPISKATMLFIM